MSFQEANIPNTLSAVNYSQVNPPIVQSNNQSSFNIALRSAFEDPLGAISKIRNNAQNINVSSDGRNIIRNIFGKECNPWSDFSYPFIYFVILFAISIIIALYIISRATTKTVKQNGVETKQIDPDKLTPALVGLIIHIILGTVIGIYIYKLSKICAKKPAWVLFWLSILIPIIFIVIVGAITGIVIFEEEIVLDEN